MQELIAQTANETICELGEGPVWDPVRERMLWLDILNGTVFTGVLAADGTIEVVDRVVFDETVGAMAVSAAGDWLVAGAHAMLTRSAAGEVTRGAQLIPDAARRRTNDGKTDPSGRFVIGTLDLDDDSDSEILVRLEPDGSVTPIDGDLGLSNGLGWSADGRTMYSIDTAARTVFARSYEPTGTAIGERRVFLTLDDGHPDGLCVDADDHLWIAIWGGAEVRRYSPTGDLVATVAVPAPHTTSVAFAGPSLDTLVITTAAVGMDAEARRAFPLAGGVFTVKPGVRGLPVALWSGADADGAASGDGIRSTGTAPR